jgi:hypothetical protein
VREHPLVVLLFALEPPFTGTPRLRAVAAIIWSLGLAAVIETFEGAPDWQSHTGNDRTYVRACRSG